MEEDVALVERLTRQQRALTAIGRHWRQYENDIDRAIQAITETAAYALNIERVSVWFYTEERCAIVCHDLYEATPRRHSRGMRIDAADHRPYFEALMSEEVLVIADATADPRTCGFARGYLEPQGIGAMLDAPIRSGGQAAGVICHEHVGGARPFYDDEASCAMYLGSMVSAMLELQNRREREWEARRMLSLLQAAFEAAGSALLALNTEGHITDKNQFAVELWHLHDHLPASQDGRELMRHMASLTVDPEHFISRTRAVRDNPEAQSRDELTLLDGRVIECISQPQRVDGMVVGRVWSYHDITQRRQLENELRLLSHYDPLTGLANRRRLSEALDQEIFRRQRGSASFCVAMLDIDHFKAINDTYGHPVGDQVLQDLANELRERMRVTDVVCRWGGEEFLILMPGITRADAVRVMNELRVHLARERTKIPSFTVSIGIAEHDEGQTAEDLIKASDDMLYTAKQGGRNRVEA